MHINQDPRVDMPNFSEGLKLILKKCLRKNPNDRYRSGQEFIADIDRLIQLPSSTDADDFSTMATIVLHSPENTGDSKTSFGPSDLDATLVSQDDRRDRNPAVETLAKPTGLLSKHKRKMLMSFMVVIILTSFALATSNIVSRTLRQAYKGLTTDNGVVSKNSSSALAKNQQQLPSTATTENPEINGRQKIAFVRDGDIWIINVDGTWQKNLTNSDSREDNPSWSPDGKKIVFNEEGKIITIDIGGTHAKQLVYADENEKSQDPEWSPDGTTITALKTGKNAGEGLLALVNAKTLETRIIDAQLKNYAPINLSWSPDGSKIFFSNSGDDAGSIGVIDVQTGMFKTLIQSTPWVVGRPSCSPDDKYIAYTNINVLEPRATWQLKLMSPTGKNKRILLTGIYPSALSWSPDSRNIAYCVDRNDGGWSDIYIFDLANKKSRLLTAGADSPSWQP